VQDADTAKNKARIDLAMKDFLEFCFRKQGMNASKPNSDRILLACLNVILSPVYS
jgi:hypothetical protein